MRVYGGRVQELFGATPLPGQCVPGEEGGPAVGYRVEVTLPPCRELRAPAPPEDETPGVR